MIFVKYVFVLLCLYLLAAKGDGVEQLVYDFIIVGSGDAGSIVATRLAENFTTKSVLVIEAGWQGQRDIGGTDFVASKFKQDPAVGHQVLDPIPYTRYDVPVFTNSIRDGAFFLNNTWGINNHGPFNAQAKIVGGNMASNGYSWTKTFRIDYDLWNISGYSSADIWPYYKLVENVTGTGYEGDTVNHGTTGPIKISQPDFFFREANKFYNASLAAGYTNQGDPTDGQSRTGLYVGLVTVHDGVRVSSSVAYLAPALRLPNLSLWRGKTVTRVLFTAAKVAYGVEYVDYYGNVGIVLASTEVILSAGTLQTAKTLFNSGIGPKSVLQAFNKPQIVVNEMIGQKIRNQQSFTLTYFDPTQVNANLYDTPDVSLQYAESGTGIWSSAAAVYVSVKVNASHPHNDVRISAQMAVGATTSLYAQNVAITLQMSYNIYANGSLNLTSSNPLANSSFTTNAFVNQEDVDTAARGVIAARQIMLHYPNATETFPGAQYATPEELYPIIRASGSTVCHYYSSVPLGATSDWPLDLRMRVRGVQRLRVVDASVIPKMVSYGMQAQTAVFAEIGAHLIIQDHS